MYGVRHSNVLPMSSIRPAVRTSVVVITRNRPEQLWRCYNCLRQQTYSEFQTIIVDNSTDERISELSHKLPGVDYFHVEAPLGAQPLLRNSGIRIANGEIIAFLDDDGYAEATWLDEIVQCFADPSVGAVGGRIVQGDVIVDCSHVGRFRLFGGVEGNWNFDGSHVFEVDHLQGTNMSFRASILKSIGGWDEAYCGGYATYEEADVCLRVKRRGFSILFNPRAVVVHVEALREGTFGRTVNVSPRLAYYTGRNGTYLFLKNLGSTPDILLAALLINPLIETMRCLFGSARNPKIAKASLKGIWAAILHWIGVVRGIFLRASMSARKSDFLAEG
jgi:GT2 family glycosyltransferase